MDSLKNYYKASLRRQLAIFLRCSDIVLSLVAGLTDFLSEYW